MGGTAQSTSATAIQDWDCRKGIGLGQVEKQKVISWICQEGKSRANVKVPPRWDNTANTAILSSSDGMARNTFMADDTCNRCKENHSSYLEDHQRNTVKAQSKGEANMTNYIVRNFYEEFYAGMHEAALHVRQLVY